MAWKREYKSEKSNFSTWQSRPVLLTDQDLRDLISTVGEFAEFHEERMKFEVDDHASLDPHDLFDLPARPRKMTIRSGASFFVYVFGDGVNVHHFNDERASETLAKVRQVIEPRAVKRRVEFLPGPRAVVFVVAVLAVGIAVNRLANLTDSNLWIGMLAAFCAQALTGLAFFKFLGNEAQSRNFLERYEDGRSFWERHNAGLVLLVAVLAVLIPTVLTLYRTSIGR